MKNVNLILIFTIASCIGKEINVNSLAKEPIKFAKTKSIYPEEVFELYVPIKWQQVIENYEDTDQFVLGMDVASKQDKNGFINVMSIRKELASTMKATLDSEVNSAITLINNNPNYKYLGRDSFTIDSKKAICVHFRSKSKEYGAIEVFEIILPSETKGQFYHLIASISKTKQFKMNAAIMIQSLLTFKENTKNMSNTNPEINKILERLKEGMIDFIEPGSTTYQESDVEDCIELIEEYLKDMGLSNSKDEGMKIVEKTVVSLNELNERVDYELIETDQREDIAEIIIIASSMKGYNSIDEDITEEWREW